MSVTPEIAKDLSEKSNQELIAILENPSDWLPQIVEFARSELGRRLISTEQIDQTLAVNAKQKGVTNRIKACPFFLAKNPV